jgi:hypothetical protein
MRTRKHRAQAACWPYIYFDSKFFKTLIPLITKPGFLVNEYNNGKRNKYLTPVKLYFFLSFLYFFLSFNFGGVIETSVMEVRGKGSNDSNLRQETIFVYHFDTTSTVQKYDSIQSTLPANQRDGSISTWYNRRFIGKLEKWKGNYTMFSETLNEKFNATIPQIVFLLMPFVALLLKLFYLKRKIYLIDHLTFSLNLHAFVFLLLSIFLGIDMLLVDFQDLSSLLFLILLLTYIFVAFRKVYNGKIWLTVLKVFSILTLYVATLAISIVLASVWAILMF